MNDIVERLLSIDEVQMYDEPATTKRTIDKAAAYIQSLRTQLKERDEALEQIASCESHAVGDVVDIALRKFHSILYTGELVKPAPEAMAAMQAALTASGLLDQVKVLREALEEIDEDLQLAVQADCENGVKCLNERAARQLNEVAPATLAAIGRVSDRIEALNSQQENLMSNKVKHGNILASLKRLENGVYL